MSWLTPHIPARPDDYEPWTRKQLLVSGVVALIVLSGVGILFVGPAEYGVDPTGVGESLRLTELHQPVQPEPEPEPPTINVTPLSAFPYDWVRTNSLFFEADGDLAAGESTTIPVEVLALNVSRVTAFLTWEDEAAFGEPEPDTFTVALSGPSGSSQTTASNSGSAGTASTNVTASAVPSAGNVTAQNQTAATQMIHAQQPARSEGTGTWDVTITLDDVADLIGDDGNTWRLQVFVETFALTIGTSQPTPIQEVTVELTLPATGQWKEYKVGIVEGKSLTYEWIASGELQWDFHGRDVQTGKETSHLSGVSSGENGELIVPFSGQHGWAFRNRGSTDVDLTITLRGPFVLLG